MLLWRAQYRVTGMVTLLPFPNLLKRFPGESNGPSGPLYFSLNINQQGASLPSSLVTSRVRRG